MDLETGTITHIWHLFSTGKVLLSEICRFLSSSHSPKGKIRSNFFLHALVDYSRLHQTTTMPALRIQIVIHNILKFDLHYENKNKKT